MKGCIQERFPRLSSPSPNLLTIQRPTLGNIGLWLSLTVSIEKSVTSTVLRNMVIFLVFKRLVIFKTVYSLYNIHLQVIKLFIEGRAKTEKQKESQWSYVEKNVCFLSLVIRSSYNSVYRPLNKQMDLIVGYLLLE